MSRFGLGFVSGGQGIPGNDAFTKILLHMDGANGGASFVDSNAGGSAHSWGSGGALTSTAAVKFGSASMAGSYISAAASADFNLGSSDWTVDFWFNTNGSGGGTQRIFCGQINSAGAVGSASFFIEMTTGNILRGLVSTGSTFIIVTGATSITAAGWHHAALVRTGNVLNLFIDGGLDSANVSFTGAVNSSANNFSIGRNGEAAASGWVGFIDEFRLSVGIARWTSNFTPPNAPYI